MLNEFIRGLERRVSREVAAFAAEKLFRGVRAREGGEELRDPKPSWVKGLHDSQRRSLLIHTK